LFNREVFRSRKLVGREVAVFLSIIAGSVLIFYVLAAGSADYFSTIFHVISASTTSGFQYLDFHGLPTAAKIFLVIVMFIGGAAFSTAGGIKVGRFIILYQEFFSKRSDTGAVLSKHSTSSSISSTANPYRGTEFFDRLKEGRKKTRLEQVAHRQQRTLRDLMLIANRKIVREILVIIALYVFVALVGASVLQFLTTSSYEDSLFESVSALSGTGISIGVTTLDLDLISKLLLTMNMIIGRFEIIAILYIFFSYFRK
jgi:trk system potassium uptake protein